MVNRILAHRYKLLEKIGGGGMATVYRAQDNLLERPVAVKVLHQQFTHDQEFISRFRREAQAAAKLSHPNIVNMYDVGCDQDTHYIVMEYVSGGTLKEEIQQHAPLPLAQALQVASNIAEALDHAHQHQLVHCDIKPHNILIQPGGRVKVTDFGIARAVTSTTMSHTGTVFGSVHYFSPEQAKGLPVSAQSDIYSLGVVLYEMLTGTLPFQGESPVAIALHHLQQEPDSPRLRREDLPPMIEAIVLKALRKVPSERYQSAGHMLADLRLALGLLERDGDRPADEFATQLLTPMDWQGPQDRSATVKQDLGALHRNETMRLKRGFAEPSGKPPAKKRTPYLIFALVMLLLIGFGTGAFMAYGKFWSSSEVTVPSVVGQQADVAKNALMNLNLRVSISESYDPKVPPGQVISQYPEAGAVVKEQRMVTLLVSKGGDMAIVPDLRGLSRSDAELQLRNAGLVVGRITEQASTDVPAGSVVSQNPRPPAQVAKNTPVDIVVSKGDDKKKVSVPDIRGLSVPDATAKLSAVKLSLGKVAEESGSSGVITLQNPAPGSEAAEGSYIDVTLGRSGGGSHRSAVQFTVPSGPQRQAVQIAVTDSSGRRIVYESVHKPGDRIEKTVEGSGSMKVQIYVNGNLLQEQTP